MASIGSVTRQIASLEISNKKSTNSSSSSSSSSLKSAHTKHPSQGNVSKLLTKFAAPNPLHSSSNTNKPLHSSSLRYPTSTNKTTAHSTTVSRGDGLKKQVSIDIGQYDGGLELENEKRGERVFGEAAEELALDSSHSKYAIPIALRLSN
jgi:aurora kinase